ncbi:hypothetical protein ACJJTC_014681 [Scirpophaga incertulas]
MVRDKIVIEVQDKKLQQKLLEIKDLTLEKTVDICRSSELSKEHSRIMSRQTEFPVEVIRARPSRINNKKVDFKCDTGAQVNVLSLKDLKKIVSDDKPYWSETKIVLEVFGGTYLTFLYSRQFL